MGLYRPQYSEPTVLASCLDGMLLLVIAVVATRILWRLLQVCDPVLRELLDILNVAFRRGA